MRGFFYWLVFLAAAAQGPALSAASSAAEARATAWLKAWDGQGLHRTGTAGDAAGADWLAREAAAIGGTVTTESFHLDRIDATAAYVEIDGKKIPGEPLFDAPDTPPDGIRAVASETAGESQIAVRPLSPSAVYAPDFARQRREHPHAAEVIVTMGAAPGLAPLNAESFRRPFGSPTLQVSSLERDHILTAAARGVPFRVVVLTTRTPAEARNVVVTIPGRDRTRPPVVVMTPRSSWWQSTAERGGGLVCWLEVLRALQAAPPVCDVIFTANSGHELGHLGLEDFLAHRPGWETRATWIHFGANIGSAGGQVTVQSPNEDLRALARAHLGAAGQQAVSFTEKNVVPSGETKDIHRAGGHYLTVTGVNPLFHLPQDRWPGAVDVGTIARVAEGMAAAVVALTR